MELPQKFTERMKALLQEEYEPFLECYGQEKKQGLRVNTGKISVEDFLKLTPFSLPPIPWTENGFYYREEDRVTKHPHYYAGLYYVQEPSAMVPASRLPVEPGDCVLDLCAAPGGKATELGARLGSTGVLVANDVSASRAGALLKNLELAGVPNLYVTAETPQKLLERFGAAFDKVLVDAPCSGEGMFRKEPGLIKSWQEHGPEYYAPLQKEILSCAVQMLKPGGMLLYSTCTFSPEEDEAVVAEVLERCPEMELIRPLGWPGFAPGIPLSGYPDFAADRCIRIWPHRMDGEGHFAALLQKKDAGLSREQNSQQYPFDSPDLSSQKFQCEGCGHNRKQRPLQYPFECQDSSSRKSRGKGRGQSREMASEQKESTSAEAFLDKLKLPLFKQGTVIRHQELLLWLPPDMQAPGGLRYLRSGLLLGTIKKERFEPSQALAMALTKEKWPNVVDRPADHPDVQRYLRGETVELAEGEACAPGWTLVCCDGYPLGWGKCINGSIRNKYQPGWRMQ